MVRPSTLALAILGLLAVAGLAEAQTGPNKPQQPIPRESRRPPPTASRRRSSAPHRPIAAPPPAIVPAACPRAGTAC